MFAERLKELRKKHGITQEQLASIIGVERSSVGKYEGKDRVIPSDDIKCRIADFFQVSVDYLIGKTDIPFSDEQADLSGDEVQLLTIYRILNDAGRELVMDYVNMIASKNDYRKEVASAIGI